ncbi:dipeptidase [Aestuariivita sp.]|jgi:microsomal dipeptidase-like Zn-dependent dipeptidase|uniref:dipeptidase n=1 Tax=Aestuariivita sp. TaxID=1872407 RepID=UPI00216BF9E0|nr:dipeptidase [Aestuariivita sp.]MCE8009807.1 peptidase M19 [Aestuariivita sp.]
MRVFGKWLGRLLALIAVLVAAFLIFAPGYVERERNAVLGPGPQPVPEAAQALHDTLIIGDWHADTTLWNRDLTRRATRGQVDLPRLIDGNVAVQVFTSVTKSPAGQNYEENSEDALDNITLLAIGQLWPPRTWTSLLERALYQAEKLHEAERKAPDMLRVIRSEADLDAVLAARAAGQPLVGGILGIEGAHALEGRIENLDPLMQAGHRLIALHHFFDNALGGSLHGQSGAGLTDFGRMVVQEVERRNLILDVSHSSPQVVRDVLAMQTSPIVVSHTGIHSHCPVTRNLTDDLMQGVAATGGVIGIGYWAEVACGDITPAGIARMIAVAIEVVGEDHVSLGSDFDGSVATYFDTSQLAELTAALIDAGLTEAQIRKVMGENMIRVLRARLE